MKFEIELKEVPTAVNQPDGWYIETDNSNQIVHVLDGASMYAGLMLNDFKRISKEIQEVEQSKDKQSHLTESFVLKLLAVNNHKVKELEL